MKRQINATEKINNNDTVYLIVKEAVCQAKRKRKSATGTPGVVFLHSLLSTFLATVLLYINKCLKSTGRCPWAS